MVGSNFWKIFEANAWWQAWGRSVSIHTWLHNSTAHLQTRDLVRQMVLQNPGKIIQTRNPVCFQVSGRNAWECVFRTLAVGIPEGDAKRIRNWPDCRQLCFQTFGQSSSRHVGFHNLTRQIVPAPQFASSVCAILESPPNCLCKKPV